FAYKHTCSRSTLHLTAREFDSSRSYHSIQAIFKRLYILFHHGGMDGRNKTVLLIGISQEQILFERLTTKTRDLRGIGALRRDKELTRMGDALPIPENITC